MTEQNPNRVIRKKKRKKRYISARFFMADPFPCEYCICDYILAYADVSDKVEIYRCTRTCSN